MSWEYTLSTHIWIFSIGRGNAAFIRTGLNQAFIIDMGAGGTPEFSPASFIQEFLLERLEPYQNCKIAQGVLSHPHADHISECRMLEPGSSLSPALLTCPNDKDFADGTASTEKLNWRRICNPSYASESVEHYKNLYKRRCLPLQTIKYDSGRLVPGLEYGIFYLRPPIAEKLHPSDQDYGNATSIMFYLRHGSNSILLPGDITPEAMNLILSEAQGVEKRYTVFDRQLSNRHPEWHEKTADQPSLRWLLSQYGLSTLVAPHHGLESCYSPELYKTIRGGKPRLVVLSERQKNKLTDGKTHQGYQREEGSFGLNVELENGRLENRRSISTIGGDHILIIFEGNGLPKVYMDKDPERLLAKLPRVRAARAS